MLDEWSTQRTRRVRLCAVLAMHVPNLGIHTSWRSSCASIPTHFSSQVKYENDRSCLPHRCVNIGLFKTLRLRFALCSCSPFPVLPL